MRDKIKDYSLNLSKFLGQGVMELQQRMRSISVPSLLRNINIRIEIFTTSFVD